MKRIAPIFLIAATAIVCGCTRNSDDALVANARTLHPSVVLLDMRVPPDKKGDPDDDAYATGIVVASGSWGSDILTVQHAIDHARDLHATIDNKKKVGATIVAQDAQGDVALLRIKEPNLAVAHLGTSVKASEQIGREVGLLGYPIPDEFDDENLGLATSLAIGHLSALRKDALEVTLPIVPGESGGPVFIADTGEIIGLADSRFDDERSIGFAVPIDDVKRLTHRWDALHGL